MPAVDAGEIVKEFRIPLYDKLLAMGIYEDVLFVLRDLYFIPVCFEQRLQLLPESEVIECRTAASLFRKGGNRSSYFCQ